jgi:hypothetical protein
LFEGYTLDVHLPHVDGHATDQYAVESEQSTLGVRCFAVEVPFTRRRQDALGLAVLLSRLDRIAKRR